MKIIEKIITSIKNIRNWGQRHRVELFFLLVLLYSILLVILYYPIAGIVGIFTPLGIYAIIVGFTLFAGLFSFIFLMVHWGINKILIKSIDLDKNPYDLSFFPWYLTSSIILSIMFFSFFFLIPIGDFLYGIFPFLETFEPTFWLFLEILGISRFQLYVFGLFFIPILGPLTIFSFRIARIIWNKRTGENIIRIFPYLCYLSWIIITYSSVKRESLRGLHESPLFQGEALIQIFVLLFLFIPTIVGVIISLIIFEKMVFEKREKGKEETISSS